LLYNVIETLVEKQPDGSVAQMVNRQRPQRRHLLARVRVWSSTRSPTNEWSGNVKLIWPHRAQVGSKWGQII